MDIDPTVFEQSYWQAARNAIPVEDGFRLLLVRPDLMMSYKAAGARVIPATRVEENASETIGRKGYAGSLNVDAEGRIILGDAIAMEIPIEISDQLRQIGRVKAQRRREAIDSPQSARGIAPSGSALEVKAHRQVINEDPDTVIPIPSEVSQKLRSG